MPLPSRPSTLGPSTPGLAPTLLLVLAVAAPHAASGFEKNVPRALAEAHFSHLYAFNMVASYDSQQGKSKASFVVARRVSPERSELLMHLRSATMLSRTQSAGWRASLTERYAGLLIHNRGRSDDVLVYFPPARRVRRVAAPELEKRPVLRLLPLGDFRPIVRGELSYRQLPPQQIGGVPHRVVEGVPVDRQLSFDRVELYFEAGAPLAVQTRFFLDGRELRRVEIDPDDVQPYGNRLLPKLTRITTPEWGVTELRLRNALVDLLLPEEIFTEHNLRVQRFPHF